MEECVEQKVEAVLIKKWHLILAVVTLVSPAILFFAKIQIDIALIKQQSSYIAKSVETVVDKNKEQDNKLISQKEKIVELCSKMGISPN